MTAAELAAKAHTLSVAAATSDQHKAAATAHYEAAMAYPARSEDRGYHLRCWKSQRRQQFAAQS